jgi:hypothetical protein
MTFPRLAALTLLALWGLEALLWGRQLPLAAGWAMGMLRLALFAALTIVALRRGRRWTAPLRAFGIAWLAILGPLVVGVLTGDYLARGVYVGTVWAFLVAWTGLAIATILVVTVAARVWSGRRVTSSTVGAI